MAKTITVVIVDDSSFIRELFTQLLGADPEIEVLASACDVPDAREKIRKLNPDVITLDIEMPGMNGIEFLQKIMSLRPMPVVMVSSLTQQGAQATLEALEIGAVDYVPKTSSTSFDIANLGEQLIEKVKAAARAKVAYPPRPRMLEKVKPLAAPAQYRSNVIIGIGASTGGVEALRDVLTLLPGSCPPVVVTQHMPAAFTETFARRLNNLCHVEVCEAEEDMVLKSGLVAIAPGGKHLEVLKKSGSYRCHLNNGEFVSGHKPSVDVMFESLATAAGEHAAGAILTGMGKDGARGLLAMKRAGANTLGQDEATSIVYGMPKAAWMAGAVDVQVPLQHIARELLRFC